MMKKKPNKDTYMTTYYTKIHLHNYIPERKRINRNQRNRNRINDTLYDLSTCEKIEGLEYNLVKNLVKYQLVNKMIFQGMWDSVTHSVRMYVYK